MEIKQSFFKKGARAMGEQRMISRKDIKEGIKEGYQGKISKQDIEEGWKARIPRMETREGFQERW